ncbi:major facilitator superfamily domain-containing protein 4B-like [Haliotis rufescens]|uniref:major facilitator superfamily domain-containing protein 4B-like n=1 Tax=Haliotis rufescens TaxID=6454 RepID=UPI001EAFCB12|nr:major facilitator superfamily domain-containing protein 4B-like [Haliotis rufescens]
MMLAISRRSKLIQTFWLFWSFNHRGIHNCILGPTLLDLQLLLQKDLNALSYLFFASGLGSMLGSLAAGFLASRFDNRLQLFLSLMVGSVSIAAIPQVQHIYYMYFMVFVFGLTRGLVVCFVMQICGELWDKKGPPFHFVACGTSAGAILAPLIAKPFLCPYQTVPTNSFNETTSMSLPNSTSLVNVLDSIITEQGVGMNTVCTAEDTRVQWAFLVLGCYMLPAALSQLYYWLLYRAVRLQHGTKTPEYVELNHEEETKFEFKLIHLVFFLALSLMYILLSSLPATYSAILTVYGVQGPLRMSKDDMVTMTSLFWVGSLICRLSSGFYTRRFTNFQVIAAHLAGLAVVGIIFVSLASRFPIALWILTPIVGYFSAPYLAGVLAWVTDFLQLHPKITSLCFLASGAGNMLFPFFGGILFNEYGSYSYLYLIFSIMITMGLTYACLVSLSKALPLSRDKSYDHD